MDMKAVSKRIREARVAQHLTQEELAAKADISLTHMGVIERASKVPNLDTFVATEYVRTSLNIYGTSLNLNGETLKVSPFFVVISTKMIVFRKNV